MDHRYIFIECGIEGDENKQKLKGAGPTKNNLYNAVFECVEKGKIVPN